MHLTTLCTCVLLGFVSVAEISAEENVYVRAPVGEIVGHYKSLTRSGQQYWYSSFLSIPFAETTAGENRLRKPVKKAAFETPYVASELKPACYQTVFFPGVTPPPMSEDCLHLSVMVPGNVSETNSLAVMIWIYGGGFQFGAQDDYYSPMLAATNDVIVVFINYRVSALGFLANHKSLPGNYGLWDQHMAVHWVSDNIKAFGGDPDRVTLFGESAGSASVIFQGLYMGSQKLVSGLIAQSGSANAAWTTDPNSKEDYDAMVDRTGCKDQTEELEIECLRKISAEKFQSYVGVEDSFNPTVDGDFVKIPPQTIFEDSSAEAMSLKEYFGDLNIIMGANKHDGVIVWADTGEEYKGMTVDEFEASFVRDYVTLALPGTPSKLITSTVVNDYINWTNPDDNIMTGKHYYDLFKDVAFVVPLAQTARAHGGANGNGKLYAYEFHHKPSYSITPDWIDGAIHAEEIPFVLGFPERSWGFPGDVESLAAGEVDLSMKVMKYWSQFAKTGNPHNPADATSQVWPEYTPRDLKYIIFESNMASFPVKERMRAKYIHLWDVVVPEIMELHTDSTGCKHHTGIASGSPGHYQNGFIMLIVLVLACLDG